MKINELNFIKPDPGDKARRLMSLRPSHERVKTYIINRVMQEP